MAFCLDPSGVPKLRDHADAHQHFEKMKPWRNGHPEWHLRDARPIGNGDSIRKKKHLSIRRNEDGDYALRYHNTDVVIYHEDGSLSLNPYASVSTSALVNKLLPNNIHVDYRSGRYHSDECIVWCPLEYNQDWWSGSQHGYRIDGKTRFARNAEGWFEPLSPTEDIEVMQLDLKATAAVRKQYPGLVDFGHWIMAAVALNTILDRKTAVADIPRNLAAWVLERINDSANWVEVLEMVYRLGIPKEGWGRSLWNGNLSWSGDLMMQNLRREIYRHEDCVAVTTVPYYEGRLDFERIKKLNRIWK